ncbi:hypothetical protein MAR_031544 [Mya arenaria]|uniref:Uncharacterized protein n=1 Tax=Mya arenaria TaxID=6604 RepID=A0ABY7F476_MYAAR|nr:hypothetical protein MAR_031544 [Mya arenaria]
MGNSLKKRRRKTDDRTHQAGLEETANTPAGGFQRTSEQGNDQLQDKVEGGDKATEGLDNLSSQTNKQRDDINAIVVDKTTEIHDVFRSHQTRLENITNVLAGELEETADRTIKPQVSSFNELVSKEKRTINLLAADFEDTAHRERRLLNEDVETHKRDIDALATRRKDEISQQQKQVDEAFRTEDIPYLLYIPMRDIPPDRTHSIEDIIFAHLENEIGYQKQDREKLERSEDWLAFENNFNTAFSPDLMSFLCVMNYEHGRRCSEMFGDTEREFYRGDTFYSNEISEYQEAVLLAYNECVNNVKRSNKDSIVKVTDKSDRPPSKPMVASAQTLGM